MKGLIKIIEAVIACIIILTTLIFFITPAAESDWESSLLQIESEDALSSLYQNNMLTDFIFNNKQDEFNNILKKMLSDNTDFSIEVIGIPDPYIYIGTFSENNKNNLENKITKKSFSYKKRTITIIIDKINQNNVLEFQKKGLLDALFLSQDQIKSNKNLLKTFLSRGGIIFSSEYPDWTDDFISEIFAKSDNYNEDAKNRIEKYYRAIGGSGNIPDVYPKEDVYINGRTIYYEDFSKSSDLDIRAVLMWASGEHYKMSESKNLPKKYTTASQIAVGSNSEVYEVKLNIWYIFY